MPAYRSDVDRARARSSFSALLSRTKPAVEQEMKARFAARREQRKSLGREVRAVVDVAEDLSLRGGKRFRAALLASTFFGQSPRGSARVALLGGVALEMLQSYLLIQDDWMDGDVERRGGPSAHVALAEKLAGGPLPSERAGHVGAVLASDLVWGLAVEALLDAKVDGDVRARALHELLRIHEDVVAGQVLDTVAKKADVEVLHDLKTGSYTVRGPLVLGAVLGGATKPTLRALAKFGEPLGVAFQLRDDLLGVFGTIEEAGRPQGSDLLAAKKGTSVLGYALPKLRGAGKQAVERVWSKRLASARDMKAAISAITDTGAREAVEKRLAALCTLAEDRAGKLPLAARARDELAGASLAIRVGPGNREAR